MLLLQKVLATKGLNTCGETFFKKLLGLYYMYKLFYFIGNEGFLNTLNEIHLADPHHVSLPVINVKHKF